MKIALIILLYFGQSTEPAKIDGGQFNSQSECQVKADEMNAMMAADIKADKMIGVSKATAFCQDENNSNTKKVAQ